MPFQSLGLLSIYLYCFSSWEWWVATVWTGFWIANSRVHLFLLCRLVQLASWVGLWAWVIFSPPGTNEHIELREQWVLPWPSSCHPTSSHPYCWSLSSIHRALVAEAPRPLQYPFSLCSFVTHYVEEPKEPSHVPAFLWEQHRIAKGIRSVHCCMSKTWLDRSPRKVSLKPYWFRLLGIKVFLF